MKGWTLCQKETLMGFNRSQSWTCAGHHIVYSWWDVPGFDEGGTQVRREGWSVASNKANVHVDRLQRNAVGSQCHVTKAL